jgi:DNA-binding transcriptional MerR regulator
VEQVRYSLKELCQTSDVTERTVRYYIKEGLLPPPIGTGPLSRYTYEHWLRLQFIRRLKEEFLPLSEIKSLLADKTLPELDNLARQSGLVADEVPGLSADQEAKVETDGRLESLVRPGVAGNPARLRQQMALNEAGAEYPVETQAEAEPSALPKPGAAVSPFLIAPAPVPPAYEPPAPGAMNLMAGRGYPLQASPAQFETHGFSMRLNRAENVMPPMPRRAAPPAFIPGQEPEEILGQTWERVAITPGVELHVESEMARKHRPALNTLLEMARRLLEKEIND